MKKRMTRMLAMTLALAMVLVGAANATVVVSSNFVPSIEQKAAPELDTMYSEDGTPCYGIVYDADGNEIYLITDYGELIITAYCERIEAAADIRRNLESAYKDIADAEDLGELVEELEDAIEALSIKVGIEDLVVADLFDVTARGNLVEPLYREGAYLVVTLKTISTLSEEATFVLHDAFYDGIGQWDLRPSEVLDEHRVRVTFNGLSPVAIVVPRKDVDPNGPKSPDTGVNFVWLWTAAAVVLTAAGGCVYAATRRRHA